MRTNLILLCLIALIPVEITADSWKNPEITNYFSENGKYMLTVYPTSIPDNYYKLLSSKPKRKQKFTEKDTIIDPCHAVLYEITENDTLRIWNKKLINRIAPVAVLVANDGKSIVTFDNWHSMGYGIDVMVIYDESGGLVKRYQLEDFSPFPINDYEISISSLWWRCGAQYIDNENIKICFRDENKNIETRNYNLQTKCFN